MTVEMHAAIRSSESIGPVEQIAIPKGARKEPLTAAADLFPRLSAMRRMVDAQSFAVFTCSAANELVGGHLSLVLDDREEGEGIQAVSPSGRALLAHMERSSLPLAWPAGKDAIRASRTRTMLVEADLSDGSSGGLAFPIRLGTVGNGLVVFEGDHLRLGASVIFSLHRLAYRVMRDLLDLDMTKSAPRKRLSERELECLQWAGNGCKSEAIAEKLGLSVHTVNAYLGSATAKLDSVNRIQAIAKAIRVGFIV